MQQHLKSLFCAAGLCLLLACSSQPGSGIRGTTPPVVSSVFTQCRPYAFTELDQSVFDQPWYALPVTSGADKKDFNPVFLGFTYTCSRGTADTWQALTFPVLLAYKFDFVPDNYNASLPAFVFRKDPGVISIQPDESAKISSYIASWQASHAIGGTLVQQGEQYSGSLFVYDSRGRVVLKKTYPKPGDYFGLMANMVQDWMQFRGQQVSPALARELARPMTGDAEAIRLLGQTFREEWRSKAEWALYEEILVRDPGFGEVRYWYANQQGWVTGNQVQAISGRGQALLDHPVIPAVREFSPALCADEALRTAYANAVTLLQEILPGTALTAYLEVKDQGGSLELNRLDALTIVALDNPADYNLLHLLALQYDLRNCYEKSVPLLLSALSAGYNPTEGRFDAIYRDLARSFLELGFINLSGNFGLMGLNYCLPDSRPLLLQSLAAAFSEGFLFEKAARLYSESSAGEPGPRNYTSEGLNIFMAGNREAIAAWEAGVAVDNPAGVMQPLVKARSLLNRGEFMQAASLLEDYLAESRADVLLFLEAEIILADLFLLQGQSEKALAHATAAWRLAPRSRRVAFLLEQCLAGDPAGLGNYAEVAGLIFKGDAYYRGLLNQVKAAGYLPLGDEILIDRYNELAARQAVMSAGAEQDFWLAQAPFAVEYLALRLVFVQQPAYREAGLRLFIAYSRVIRQVSFLQEIHLRTFYSQLLAGLTKLEKARWIDLFENELRVHTG